MTINALSQIETLSMNDGALGFKLLMKGGEYRIGDRLLFYPCIDIYKYSVSDTNERFLKHILYDLYEFTFIVIDKYELDDDDHDRKKDCYHYLIETIPGFNVSHFQWLKKTDDYLKINTLYHGFGRLDNYGDSAPDNATEVMKQICCEGILEKLQINGIWRDSYEHIAPVIGTIRDAFGYQDVLKSIGYPGDMLKFQKYVSRYQDEKSSLQSTAGQEQLVYTVRMA